MEQRLLTQEEARAYLGGVDPRKVMEPMRLGGRVRWDRVALDEKLNALGKLKRRERADSPLDQWEAENDAA